MHAPRLALQTWTHLVGERTLAQPRGTVLGSETERRTGGAQSFRGVEEVVVQ
jgi:hypothetical protein